MLSPNVRGEVRSSACQKSGSMSKKSELRREKGAIFPHFLDPRIDAGNEGAGDSFDARIELLPLLLERTAIEDEPGRLVERNEGGAKNLGKPAKLAAAA